MPSAFVSAAVTSTTTQALTISAGQSVIIIAGDESAQSSALTISDGTNTYVSRGSVNDTFNGATRMLLDCLNPTPGSYTLTEGGATAANFITLVYTGLASFSAGSFKSFFSSSTATTTDGVATASITPTSYGALIVSGAMITGSGTSLSAGTGFNSRLASSAHFGNGAFAEDLRLLAGSNIASWTAGLAQSIAVVAGAYIESGNAPIPAAGALVIAGQAPNRIIGTILKPNTAKIAHRCREAVRSIFLPTTRLVHG